MTKLEGVRQAVLDLPDVNMCALLADSPVPSTALHLHEELSTMYSSPTAAGDTMNGLCFKGAHD